MRSPSISLGSPDRQHESRRLLRLNARQLARRAGRRLTILRDLPALHQHMAKAISDEIHRRNQRQLATRLILPVGPVDQYPLLAERINRKQITLRNAWLFFMDEYCDDAGQTLPVTHPLSFCRIAHDLLLDRIDRALRPPKRQVVFPTHLNVHKLAKLIDSAGGIDTCYGGIGMHGHVAFNEPEPHIADSEPRLVYLNDVTRTINCLRAGVGGNLTAFPRKAITLGMRQILQARRVRLYCRNGMREDWANLVLRLAVLGTPGDDYPVTHLAAHRDLMVVTDEATASKPSSII